MKTWIYFEHIKNNPKTSVWAVKTKEDNTTLGIIKWFPRWRKYAFFPEDATVYEPDCLKVISDKINYLMYLRKINKDKK